MKIAITESQYNHLMEMELDELMLQPDIERLSRYGMVPVDTYIAGPYEASLVKTQSTGQYQIGLSTVGELFVGSEYQRKRPTTQQMRTIKFSMESIMNKIKEWYDEYGTLFVGSHEIDKVRKYHRLFKRFGWEVTDIDGLGFYARKL